MREKSLNPPATLSFISVERYGIGLYYYIKFKSDIDIMNLFDRDKRVDVIYRGIECALADDTDFAVDKSIQFSARGLVDPDESKGSDVGLSYIANARLVETYNNQSSTRYLTTSELNQFLSNKQQVPCKVLMTAWGYKPYYSNTMNIPVADLLREINEP